MKKSLNIILCIILLVLLGTAVFVGCNKSELTLSVELTSMTGAPIEGVTVDVSLDGKQVASGKTGADGKFTFKGESAKYDIQLSDAPESVTLTNDGKFGFDANKENTTLKLSFVDDNDLNFTVQSVGGARLEGVTVTLFKDGQPVGEPKLTNANGIAAFGVEIADYEYEISTLPNGYYFADPADARGRTNGEKKIRLSYPSKVTKEPMTDRMYRQGDIFFDFTIEDAVTGTNYTLSQILADKKMVLINFWNTSCSPCVGEMPSLNIAYKQYQNDVEVLAVSSILGSWDSEVAVRNFASRYTGDNALAFPLFADGPYKELGQVHFAQYISLNALPTNVVIDRYGRIAMIKSGASGTNVFEGLFQKYSANDYVQENFGSSEGDGGDEEPEKERLKPDVQQADSATIKAAINGDGFDGEWYPEQGDDAEYSWPWEVAEVSDGSARANVKVLRPTNHYKDYSFATIKTKVTISEEDIENGGKVALVFDLKYSTELWGDFFYVFVNSELVYSYTGTEYWDKWQRCYALVAEEPGEYELALLYNKDDMDSGGEDIVYIKNVRLISKAEVNAESQTLDMPRDAAKNWNESTKLFDSYAPYVLAPDGYYHYQNQDGPYILANLFSLMPYQVRRGEQRNVSEAATAGIGIFKPELGEEISANARAITPYLQAANNSELSGLTVVDKTLHDLLNAYAQDAHSECNDNAWLEFCTWFEHYGADSSDKGISTFDRNPVRGLMQATAIPMAQVHQGRFEDTSDIDKVYKNNVVIDRVIMPRGIIYKLTPVKSGAYRFRSQSSEFSDTTAWLRAEGMDVNNIITEFGEEREDPDASWNFIMTWYLEKDKTYYLSVSLADVGGTGEFTFTTEYLGEKFYSWQAVSRALVTFEEGEGGEMGALKNYNNAYPVLADDGFYYDAQREQDGTPKRDAQGNLIPDKNDPIYVDFLHGTRFMEQSIADIITMASSNDIRKRLTEKIFPEVFENMPSSVLSSTRLTQLNGGAALSDDDWQRLAAQISVSYGDTVSFDNVTFALLKGCTKVGDITDLLLNNFFNAFDFRGWRGQGVVHYDLEGAPVVDGNGQPIVTPMWQYVGVSGEEDLANYTPKIKDYLAEAQSKTTADHSEEMYGGEGFDAGCLKLNEELCTILKLFAQRYGWTGLQTDWMRLCYHYEYIGPYEG